MTDCILVNGARREVTPGTTVDEVVAGIAPDSRGIAVAVNGEVVPRSSWAGTAVAAGDRIEVLTAAQGG